LLGSLSLVTFSAYGDESNRYESDCGYGWGRGHMMNSGYQNWEPRYGRHMDRRGWGMHGYGRGIMPNQRGWESMRPEERQKWKKMRSNYQLKTLELRKKVASKQIELETLWAQSDVDDKKIEKLTDEINALQAELAKKHDKYLLRCRSEFGDQGWVCPGGAW
jgi:hypothetical protein